MERRFSNSYALPSLPEISNTSKRRPCVSVGVIAPIGRYCSLRGSMITMSMPNNISSCQAHPTSFKTRFGGAIGTEKRDSGLTSAPPALTLVALGFQLESLALLTRHISLPSALLLAHWRAKSLPTVVVRRRFEELFHWLHADTVLRG
jgi:hypothetical protein